MKKIWKSTIGYFGQGLLFLVPISITIYVIYMLFSYIENLTSPLELKYLGVQIPGMGLLIMLLFITVIGIIATIFGS